jgi:hypothetical protein
VDWKQPEGLRRHWLLEELDAELLFKQLPVGAAQGRMGDDVYDLRDNGMLRKRRTLAADGTVLATLEERAGGGGTLRIGDAEYNWKPTNLMGTRWALQDAEGQTLFSYITKPGLVKRVNVELGTAPPETLGIPMLLCWYAMVL